jgi:hypothetical protein
MGARCIVASSLLRNWKSTRADRPRALELLAIGLDAGVALGLVAARATGALLYGLEPRDPPLHDFDSGSAGHSPSPPACCPPAAPPAPTRC